METRTQEATTGIQFENNGSVNFTASTETFDRLVRPFAIRSERGDSGGRLRLSPLHRQLQQRKQPQAQCDRQHELGRVLERPQPVVYGSLDYSPNYHLNLDLSYSRNHVTLPNGEFTTQLLGARMLYGFSPRAFFNAFVQYNADTHQVSSNLRFNFTHHPLSDIYVVYNDRRDTTGGELVERAFIVKVTNLFNF